MPSVYYNIRLLLFYHILKFRQWILANSQVNIEHFTILTNKIEILKTFSFKIRYKTDNLEEKLLVSEHQDLIHQAESYLILAHKLQFCNGIRSDHSYNIRISFKSGTLFFEIVGNNHV